jgi:hypothetical protein
MSACIIPLGPEWQDPLAVQNSSPFFEDATPPFGSVNVMDPTFRVVISDLNVGDTLHVRFLSDFPPFDRDVTRTLVKDQPYPPTSDGRRLVEAFELTVPCDELSLQRTSHQLHVILADREFTDPSERELEEVKEGGRIAIGSWVFEGCPQ